MKYKVSLIFCMLLALFLFGCGKRADSAGGDIYLYYVSTEELGLEAIEYNLQAQDVDSQVQEMFDELKKSQEALGITSSVPSNVNLEKYKLQDKQLDLYFGTSYYDMKKGTEILMRAAVVQTMIQLEGVEYVSFYVGEEALKDSYGEVIGIMNGESFVQNTSSSLYSYQTTPLKLYFANEDGTKLKQETQENVHYDVSTSLEKLVLEQLMSGPEGTSLSPTIPESVKLLGISVKDGVCYVNLSSSFLTNIYNQKPEVTVYSIVNSLIANANVLKVQILIEGASDALFLNTVDLSKPLEWNDAVLEEQVQS